MFRTLLMLVAVTCSGPAAASQISGQGKAIDSTTIQIDGQRIMLFGVDSVMRKQVCSLDGQPWQCWPMAVRILQSLLDPGPATCDVVGEPDVFGRVLARCEVNGKSINEQLVSQGFAVARPSDTTDYVAAEIAAKAQKIGLWRGQFLLPGDFRRSVGIAVERP